MDDGEHEDQLFPAIETSTCYVIENWLRDIYSFCEDDSSFSFLCNHNQDCPDGFSLVGYLGKYTLNSLGSPLQINVPTMERQTESV
ncbi:hypothetical protein JM18_005936 [Phytophthora kernoviae]|uniref:Uncharacterized protein n=2 Tax=Phytophthora kernoviae TaxID=325452 RepID=A0A921SGX0_9STRA|nr:hypothetical protein G195_007805 [Phytophthora kernoviae 00238/432]KAG2522907.1 hypothetical protein JM18_005936 [Phytophthora kernoviae]